MIFLAFVYRCRSLFLFLLSTSLLTLHAAEQSCPPPFTAAPNSQIDRATKLPKRILHQPTGLALILIPAGEFQMGSPESEPERSKSERLHRRVIRKPFYIAETEVTVAQFRKFIESTGYLTDAERGVDDGNGHGIGSFAATPNGEPSPREWSRETNWKNPFPHFKTFRPLDNHPVVHVSWNDAQAFAKHFGFQLPTEAQWEYAARAGSRDPWFWGAAPEAGHGYANLFDDTYRRQFTYDKGGFPFDDGHALISPVATFKPNPWGLHDMIGNVVEWTQDALTPYPGDGADESTPKPTGGLLRGGCWLDHPFLTRSAKRVSLHPAARRDFIGFRITAPLGSVGDF